MPPRAMIPSLSLAAGPPRDWIGRLWTWWIAELRGLLPDLLLRHFERQPRNAMWLRVAADELTLGLLRKGQVVSRRFETSTLRTATSAPTPTGSLRLDPELVFETTLVFPAQAEASLRQIIGHHLGLVIPLDPETIAFDHVIIQRDPAARTLRVAVAVTKQATLARARQAAWQAGFSPVEAVVDRGQIDRQFDFLRHEPRTPTARSRNILLRAVEAAALVLILAAVGVALYRTDASSNQLASRIALMRAKADEVVQSQRKADQLAEALAVLQARLGAPSQQEILLEVTRLLPDDTSLSFFRAHEGGIEMMGSSRHAARLIGLLEGSVLFKAPRFQSPVTTNQDGSEQFDLVAAVGVRPP